MEIVNPETTSKRDMSVKRRKEKVPPEGIKRNWVKKPIKTIVDRVWSMTVNL